MKLEVFFIGDYIYRNTVISGISSGKDIFDRATPYYNVTTRYCKLTVVGITKRSCLKLNLNTENDDQRTLNLMVQSPVQHECQDKRVEKVPEHCRQMFPMEPQVQNKSSKGTLSISYSYLPIMAKIVFTHNNNKKVKTRLVVVGKATFFPFTVSRQKCHVDQSEKDEGKHYI